MPPDAGRLGRLASAAAALLLAAPARGGPCDAGCSPLAATGAREGSAAEDLRVTECLQVLPGLHVYRWVHVLRGGTLCFLDVGSPEFLTDFRARSVLVQQGGRLAAGSPESPFASKLAIGLWGGAGEADFIRCMDHRGGEAECYDPGLVREPHFCVGGGPVVYGDGHEDHDDDPCASREMPEETGLNSLFEGYHPLHGDGGALFGRKVLAVSYGGSLELFGKKGAAPWPQARVCPTPDDEASADAWAEMSGESWTRLASTAPQSSTQLNLTRKVSTWDRGDVVIVGTTDWLPSHSERANLSAAPAAGPGARLAAPLSHTHRGDVYRVRSGDVARARGPEVEMRAAVGLLTRSIVVRSLGRSPMENFAAVEDCALASRDARVNEDCHFGGHTIVRQGFRAFRAQGVEFFQLGQGGRIGHYPIHFHLAKSTRYTYAAVVDCAIHESMTRFITIHGTHDVVLARNVGYLSMGHGFYLEDASEIDNLLCFNLGISARGAIKDYFIGEAAKDPSSPTARAMPAILNSSGVISDTASPTMFWVMNAWNEFVGNAAVGVMGFGACFWLLGSTVSGASRHLHFEGYADFNRDGHQAPLKRFRGNACHTSAYALLTTAEGVALTDFFEEYKNLEAPSAEHIPRVTGNFYGTMANRGRCLKAINVCEGGAGSCDRRYAEGDLAGCTMSIVDRFTTSFNWGRVDFGAMWLRDNNFAVLRGAVTDQLFGGLGFVSGGSWQQVLPGNIQIVKDTVFVGVTQGEAAWQTDVDPRGPTLLPGCTAACRVRSDGGIAIFTGGLNAKRLVTIYDGPFYADNTAFEEVRAFVCDFALPVEDEGEDGCRIYRQTQQPLECPDLVVPPRRFLAPACVVNVAVGWKQPNNFYYPPAFAFERSHFEGRTPRHNVLKGTASYTSGLPGMGPADIATVLNDLDGTLNGMVWEEGAARGAETTALSDNPFFNAPAMAMECMSFGCSTIPNTIFSTVIAQAEPVRDGVWSVFPGRGDRTWTQSGARKMVLPVYRQQRLGDDEPGCDEVCGEDGEWKCRSAHFLNAPSGSEQLTFVTQNFGTYYLDTSPPRSVRCATAGLGEPEPQLARFAAGDTYVLYHLFARPDSEATYELHVGSGFDPSNASSGEWVYVLPHVTLAGSPRSSIIARVEAETSELLRRGLRHSASTGVLTVTIDNAQLAELFSVRSRQEVSPAETCLPHTLCRYVDGRCAPVLGVVEASLSGLVEDICGKWASRTSGTTDSEPEVSLAECPARGCLGYRFTLPEAWEPAPYAEKGKPLSRPCFDRRGFGRRLVVSDAACAGAPWSATDPERHLCPA